MKGVLRGVLDTGEEVTGEWRKMDDEELHDLYPFLFLSTCGVQSRFRNPVSSSDAVEIPRI